jgi:hypothetical protein
MRALPLVWVLMGCPGNRVPHYESQVPVHVRQASLSLAGTVSAGRYRDGRDPFEIIIPEGWIARPGPADGPLRVTFEQIGTGARVEVWSYVESDLKPRRRERCNWTYSGSGHFSVLSGDGLDVQTATCVPEEPRADRLFAYMVAKGGRGYHFEVYVPTDGLVAGKAAGEGVIAGLDWLE